MYVIIIGASKMGCMLAEELAETSNDVCVVDRKGENTGYLGSGFNGKIINGIEIDINILEEAGIKEADVVLALTQNDNINIVSCEIAQKIYKVPTVIGRVYNEEKSHIYEYLGIKTIHPIKLAVGSLREEIKCVQ